jgi:CelD/BcsL family acetyltransferase involved in cellulose biosynthesis
MTINPECDFQIEASPSLVALEKLWRALDSEKSGSFFTSWAWVSSWLATLPADLHPQLITAKREAQTVGAAIAFRSTRKRLASNISQLQFNATGSAAQDCITVEHNDFAGESGLLPFFVRWFADQKRDAELVLPGASAALSAGGVRLIHSEQKRRAFSIRQLGKISEDGLGAVLSRNTRQQLTKSLRDFGAFGILATAEATSVDEGLEYFEGLKALHIKSLSRRNMPHAFRHPYFEAFHRALIENGMPRGKIQLLKVSAGDRIVGYLYNFRHRNRICAYQSGFSDDDWRLRPGYVCHAQAIELNARQGMMEYDFLAGENQLKSSLSDTQYELGWHSFAKPSPITRLESAARAVRRLIGG